jgi:acetoin utilization protein AcuB
MLIKDILIPRLITISPQATMAEAERILKESNIRHLPVFDGKEIVGIISDRDVQRARVVLRTSSQNQTLIQHYKKVSEYMASPVKTMSSNRPLADLNREMIRQKISSFIIVDEKSAPVGIITTEDLLLVLLDKLESGVPLKIFKKFLRGFQS